MLKKTLAGVVLPLALLTGTLSTPAVAEEVPFSQSDFRGHRYIPSPARSGQPLLKIQDMPNPSAPGSYTAGAFLTTYGSVLYVPIRELVLTNADNNGVVSAPGVSIRIKEQREYKQNDQGAYEYVNTTTKNGHSAELTVDVTEDLKEPVDVPVEFAVLFHDGTYTTFTHIVHVTPVLSSYSQNKIHFAIKEVEKCWMLPDLTTHFAIESNPDADARVRVTTTSAGWRVYRDSSVGLFALKAPSYHMVDRGYADKTGVIKAEIIYSDGAQGVEYFKVPVRLELYPEDTPALSTEPTSEPKATDEPTTETETTPAKPTTTPKKPDNKSEVGSGSSVGGIIGILVAILAALGIGGFFLSQGNAR